TQTGSAKLDALIPQIEEVLEEGHKALVFSQFTSFLAIVRKRLDQEKIPYLYLDGKTRDRESLVRKFQDDSQCPVFLISLKAGGVRLVPQGVEFFFPRGPWENPVVEAQRPPPPPPRRQPPPRFSLPVDKKRHGRKKSSETEKIKPRWGGSHHPRR